MSDQNQIEGRYHYLAGTAKDREWFEWQWMIWPKRADERKTTNLSFLYGGVTGYRTLAGRDPQTSADLRTHVDWLDRHQLHPASNARQDEGTVV